jgi:glycosyltransferase involved in cell wall biosynthesis
MILTIIAYASVSYLAVRLGVVLVNLITRSLLPGSGSKGRALNLRVSVLIPARNEEENIGKVLDDLAQLDENILEILVYDDDSNDHTAFIIKEKALKDGRIRYIRGEGPKEGWLGKNHACHALAKESGGDLLLFLDADVRVEKGLIEDSISYLERYQLDLLSLFPVQEMKSLGEWLTVPLMNKILLGNLPLILIRKLRIKDFAAANGQFMLFRSEVYKQNWFHETVKQDRVEDIGIIRHTKMLDYRTMTLLSGGQVHCRMYSGYSGALKGFAKNINAFFGNNWLILMLYVILTTLGPLAVYALFSLAGLLLYVAVLVALNVMISLLSRQFWVLNVVLMPLQQASLVILFAMAAWRQLTGKMEWKGRKI